MNFINKKTSKKLFDSTITDNNFSKDDYKTLTLIEFFTLDKENRKKYLENLNEEIYDYDPPYDIDTKKYTIDTIEYYKISDIVKDDICNELISINRYGKCHKGAIMLLSLDDSNILSGYVNSNGKLYFHSIVEIGDYIMDYTKNLFIKKEDYFRLTSFKLIQKITREDYFKDMNILSDFTGIDLRIYLAFRDELIKELNNKKLTLKD